MSTDGHLTETSFGGVVVHRGHLLVITPTGKRVTGLPKGGLEPGETPEQAAAREVRKETGITARVLRPLGDVTYWYRRGGRRIPLSDAPAALSYAGERALIEQTLSSRLGAR